MDGRASATRGRRALPPRMVRSLHARLTCVLEESRLGSETDDLTERLFHVLAQYFWRFATGPDALPDAFETLLTQVRDRLNSGRAAAAGIVMTSADDGASPGYYHLGSGGPPADVFDSSRFPDRAVIVPPAPDLPACSQLVDENGDLDATGITRLAVWYHDQVSRLACDGRPCLASVRDLALWLHHFCPLLAARLHGAGMSPAAPDPEAAGHPLAQPLIPEELPGAGRRWLARALLQALTAEQRAWVYPVLDIALAGDARERRLRAGRHHLAPDEARLRGAVIFSRWTRVLAERCDNRLPGGWSAFLPWLHEYCRPCDGLARTADAGGGS